MQLTVSDLEKAIGHMQAALAILNGDNEESPRNPEHFRDTGHLSDKGIAHLHGLFASGLTTYAAAKAMGISYRATSLRHEDWRRKNK